MTSSKATFLLNFVLLNLVPQTPCRSQPYFGFGGGASHRVYQTDGTYNLYDNNSDKDTLLLAARENHGVSEGLIGLALGFEKKQGFYLAVEGNAYKALGQSELSLTELTKNSGLGFAGTFGSLEGRYQRDYLFDLMIKAGGKIGNTTLYFQAGPSFSKGLLIQDANRTSQDDRSPPDYIQEDIQEFGLGAGVGMIQPFATGVALDFSTKAYFGSPLRIFQDFLLNDTPSYTQLTTGTSFASISWLASATLKLNHSSHPPLFPKRPLAKQSAYLGLNTGFLSSSVTTDATLDMFPKTNSDYIKLDREHLYGLSGALHGGVFGIEQRSLHRGHYIALESSINLGELSEKNTYQEIGLAYHNVWELESSLTQTFHFDVVSKIGFLPSRNSFGVLYLQGGYGLSCYNLAYNALINDQGSSHAYRAVPFGASQSAWFHQAVLGLGVNAYLGQNFSLDLGARALISQSQEVLIDFSSDPEAEEEGLETTSTILTPLEWLSSLSLRYHFA